jgi:hypothetical protein
MMEDEMQEVFEIQGRAKPKRATSEKTQRIKAMEERAKESAELARKLKMTALKTQDLRRVSTTKAIEWCKSRDLTPLTEEELDIWSSWLPTAYWSNENFSVDAWRSQSFDRYSYHEGVPMHVRQLMLKAKKVFDVLEIRTPEKKSLNDMDPALFGHIVHPNNERDVVLLARWAESDANFISFEEIRDIVIAKRGILYPLQDVSEMTVFDLIGTVMTLGLIPCTFIGVVVGVFLKEMGIIQSGQGIMYIAIAFMLIPTVCMILDRLSVFAKTRSLRRRHPEIAHMV